MRIVLTFFLLTSLGFAKEPEPRKVTDEELKEALIFAEKWNLPQPSAKAKIVKYLNGSHYDIGFIEPEEKSKLHRGFRFEEIHRPDDLESVADPDSMTLEKNRTPELIFGIQLARAGYRKLGRLTLEAALNRRFGIGQIHDYFDRDEPLVAHLAVRCIDNEFRELDRRDPNYARLMAKLQRYLADQPKLLPRYRSWLDTLQATLAHRPAARGTVEQAIDQYLLSGISADQNHPWAVNTDDPRVKPLIMWGFKAVPALLKQRDSIRATNHTRIGFNNFPTYRKLAGEVICDYLYALANEQFETEFQEDALDVWWERASALGEEGYVRQFTVRLRPEFSEEGTRFVEARISDELLLLARERYPDSLPETYAKLLKSKEYSEVVLEALMDSKTIPEQQKLELLIAGIATNHEAHRNAALEHMLKLQPQQGEAILLDLLKRIPDDIEEIDGDVVTQNVWLAAFVADAKDPRIWQEYTQLLRRAEPTIAMELIHLLNVDPPLLRKLRKIDEPFRVSEALRRDQPFGFFAAHMRDKITMRNFLHLQWAEWLNLDLKPPKASGTDDEWATFRAQVAIEILRWEKQVDPPAK